MKKVIAKQMTRLIKTIAVKANGAVSIGGTYQPLEPACLRKKSSPKKD